MSNKDLYTITKAVEADPGLADSAALATLVKVTGSYFRQVGARMLIATNGTTVGSVSGGCLEEDLIEQAHEIIKLGRPKLLPFSTLHTRAQGNESIRGCGGEVEILVEPLSSELVATLSKAHRIITHQGQTLVMGTVFKAGDGLQTTKGDRLIISSDSVVQCDLADQELVETIKQDMALVFDSGRASSRTYVIGDSQVDLFLERLQPPTSVLIIGAGEVAASLTAMANELGWSTTLADHRPGLAVAEQYCLSECVTLDAPAECHNQLTLDDYQAAVVLTHICQADLEYLGQLLDSSISYIGLLGSSRRVSGLLGMLKEINPAVDDELLDRIYGPIGLDLGNSDPSGIALSILAEIQAVLAGRTAQSMKKIKRATTITPARIED